MQKPFKIISGGQTGVDRAALDVALELKFSCGGWCPKRRKAEDGQIDKKYPLIETPLALYSQRTEWNVRDSDATLILFWTEPTGGTKYTIEMAEKFKKPLCLVNMENPIPNEKIIAWIKRNNIQILNIAGPRENPQLNIYQTAKNFLTKFFQKL